MYSRRLINCLGGLNTGLNTTTNSVGNITTTGGNVGIGTNTPSSLLHVNGTLTTSVITTGNIATNNATISNLIMSGDFSAGSATASIGTLVATNASSTNLTFTTVSAGSATASIGTVVATNLNCSSVTANSLRITDSSLIATFNSNTLGSIFTTGGNVGIGQVPVAGYRLSVNGTAFATSMVILTSIATSSLSVSNITTGRIFITTGSLIAGFNSHTLGNIFTTGGNVGIGTTAPSFVFDVNGTFEASNTSGNLCFASSGNVGIGTESPATDLEINTGNVTEGATLGTLLLTSNLNYGFPGGADSGTSIVSRGRYAANGGGFLSPFGKISMRKESTANFTDSYMSFFTNRDSDRSNGGGSSLTERMRINSQGFVGIGTTNPAYQLQLSSDSAAKPSTNTWTISSDIRLKTDIIDADLNLCYNNVKSIPLKRYRWRDEVYTMEQVTDRTKIGWIAQDVELVFPKAVEQRDMFGYTDCRTLNSDQIYASMYGAIQKLIHDKETIEMELQTTKNDLSKLKMFIKQKFPDECFD